MTLYDYCIAFNRTDLLKQWDENKNIDISVNDVTYGSHKQAWWRCEKGHEWETAIYCRTGNSGTGCPYCVEKRISPDEYTLEIEYPELAKQWHPSKNLELKPSDVLPSTHRKVWWVCEKGHEWKAQIKSRSYGAGCPICTNRVVRAGVNDLATTNPELAKQWHPDKNGSLTPGQVLGGSQKKVWWVCERGHEWQAAVFSRVRGNGCPICANKIVIPGENDLQTHYPQVAAQWLQEKNGTLKAEDVSPCTTRVVWWQCTKGHQWKAAVSARTMHGSGCPYCSNQKVLAGFNDLKTIQPAIAAQWHDELNGLLTPEMVTVGSSKKVWWQCPEGHVWRAVVYSRTGKQKTGCPVCAGRIKSKK